MLYIGGYVVYDWNIPSKDEGQVSTFFQKIAYIYKLTLGGNNFYGGVGVNHIRAPLEEGLDTGTMANGDIIPCSMEIHLFFKEVLVKLVPLLSSTNSS